MMALVDSVSIKTFHVNANLNINPQQDTTKVKFLHHVNMLGEKGEIDEVKGSFGNNTDAVSGKHVEHMDATYCCTWLRPAYLEPLHKAELYPNRDALVDGSR